MAFVADYEKVFERNPERYYRLHEQHESTGMSIPIGKRVRITAWGVQNGVEKVQTRGIKTNKSTKKGCIMVRKDGNKTASSYWAGFWETD